MKLLAAVSGVIVACSTLSFGQPVDVKGEKETLMRTEEAFAQAAQARGLAGWLAYHASDAVIFPAAGPVVSGLAAIKAYYAKTGFTPEGLTWKPTSADVAASGDLGYTYGVWEWKGRDRDGKPVVERGKYVTVWKKQADGSWKLVLDIGNEDPPAPPKAP